MSDEVQTEFWLTDGRTLSGYLEYENKSTYTIRCEGFVGPTQVVTRWVIQKAHVLATGRNA
jgi:hypothetical protein